MLSDGAAGSAGADRPACQMSRRPSHNRAWPEQSCIITGDAGESFETLYAWQRLTEAGFTPRIAAPSKRRLNLVIHDFEPGWDTYIEKPGYAAESDLTFDDVAHRRLRGGARPGRPRPGISAPRPAGPRHRPRLRRGGRSGCSPSATASRSWPPPTSCKGKRVTAYEHCRWEIQAAGGDYVTADQAVRDGRIVTGQTWQSHPEFYRLVFQCLG